MKKLIFISVLYLLLIYSTCFSEDTPIMVLSYNHNLISNNLKNEQGASIAIFYKFLGFNWVSGGGVLSGENTGNVLINGDYQTSFFEHDILKIYKKIYMGVGIGYYKLNKKKKTVDPTAENLENGSYYHQNADNLFDDVICPNIRFGFMNRINKFLFLNLDFKYNFIQTNTRATLNGIEENIDLSRLSSSLGIGFLIE